MARRVYFIFFTFLFFQGSVQGFDLKFLDCTPDQCHGSTPEELFALPDETSLATGYPMPLNATTKSVQIITRSQIRYSPFHTLGGLLQYALGLDSHIKTLTDMDFAARGRNQDGANRMLVMIDWQPVNTVTLHDVAWITLPITLVEIEKIEIIRGPSSARYGAEAEMGVIHIQTKPLRRRESAIFASKGVSGLGLYDAHVAHRFDNEFGFAATVGYHQTRNPGNADFNQTREIAPNWDIKNWYDIHNFSYRFDYEGAQAQFTSGLGYSWGNGGYNILPDTRTFDFTHSKTTYLTTHLLIRTAQYDVLALRAGLRNTWQLDQAFIANQYQDRVLTSRALGLDTEAEYVSKSLAPMILGLGGGYTYLTARKDLAPQADLMYELQDENPFLRAQVEWIEPGEALRTLLQMRLDGWQSAGTVVSAELGVNARILDPCLHVRLHAGQSYKRAGFDESWQYLPLPGGGWVKGARQSCVTVDNRSIAGETLHLERLNSIEAGARVSPSDRMELSITYFYQDFRDAIMLEEYYRDVQTFNRGYRNVSGPLIIQGFEVTYQHLLENRLRLNLAYTGQFGALRQNEGWLRWDAMPAHKFSVGALWVEWVNLDLRLRYVAPIAYQEFPYQNARAYSVVDTSLYKVIQNRLLVKLAWLNALGDDHFEYPLYAEMKSNFTVSLEYYY